MNELIAFLRSNSKWFLFITYVVISCILLFNTNPYQHHVYLTSANTVASGVYDFSNEVTSYFNLRETNNDLNSRNATLQAEVLNLREQIDRLNEELFTDTLVTDSVMGHFEFKVAHVINNSVSKPYNYLTLDKGSLDGIATEMGVIDQNGVVGIVSNVGPHYARVISLLNPNFRVSAKVKNSDGFGSLVWSGSDPTMALLEELPRHTVYHKGDTVVTSGYSTVFPPGIPIGMVVNDQQTRKDNFFTLRIMLFTDFSTLSNVQVIQNNYRDELKALEAGEKEEEEQSRKQF